MVIAGSLLAPTVGRIGFWVVTLATMFAVAGIAEQIAKRFFRIVYKGWPRTALTPARNP